MISNLKLKILMKQWKKLYIIWADIITYIFADFRTFSFSTKTLLNFNLKDCIGFEGVRLNHWWRDSCTKYETFRYPKKPIRSFKKLTKHDVMNEALSVVFVLKLKMLGLVSTLA